LLRDWDELMGEGKGDLLSDAAESITFPGSTLGRQSERSKEEGIMPSSKAETLLEVIKGRRSVRAFANKKVPRDLLTKILDAGHWAPSAYNNQSCRFLVFQDSPLLETLKPFAWGFPKQAPAAILICSDQRETQNLEGAVRETLVTEDAAMAAQNLLLMAHSLGLGACVVASFSREGVTELLSLPEHMRLVLLVAIGFPSGDPRPVPREKELSQVTVWESCQEEE
jgi:nitroreductase